ncbi:MAG: hypothetical protein NC452_08845 [Eubacterium sp.]|nr:hypothetical protein [Eubacterium sp.]
MIAKLYLKEKLLCKTDEYLFCYHKGYIVLRKSADKSLLKRVRIQSAIKSVWFIERVLRYSPRAAVSAGKNNFIFSDHGKIYNYSVENNKVTEEHEFCKGMNNPLTFCVKYDESGNITDLLYGEYINNSEKKPVSVYRRSGKKWSEIYAFPVGIVMHIHNIVYDKYNDRYIIMTGDSNSESGIWEADYDFKAVKPIVSGKQIYRACVCFPQKNCIYYATDTPLEQNKLYKLQENGNGSVTLSEIYDMPGPCIFGTMAGGSLYMATSVEGDPSIGALRYKFSNKLGKGVKDRFVHIIKCSSDGAVSEIDKFKKDILPMWLFQFGNAQFPQQFGNDTLYFYPQSAKGKKGTYEIKI